MIMSTGVNRRQNRVRQKAGRARGYPLAARKSRLESYMNLQIFLDTTVLVQFFSTRNTLHGKDSWRMIDEGKKADCGSVSWLMKKCMDLLGIGGAEVRYVRACHRDWSHLWSTTPLHTENEPHPILQGVRLIMWFGGPNSFNWYEGCCYFKKKWWMGGFGIYKDSAREVLHHCCDPSIDGIQNPHQAWSASFLRYKAVPYPSR